MACECGAKTRMNHPDEERQLSTRCCKLLIQSNFATRNAAMCCKWPHRCMCMSYKKFAVEQRLLLINSTSIFLPDEDTHVIIVSCTTSGYTPSTSTIDWSEESSHSLGSGLRETFYLTKSFTAISPLFIA